MTSARQRMRSVPTNMPRNQREFTSFVLKLVDNIVATFEDIEGRIDVIQIPKLVTANRGSAQDVIALTAEDAGADASITVAQHTYQIGATDYTFGAGIITGLAYETRYFVYTDAPEYEDYLTPVYVATTNQQDATANKDRHYVGDVTTPAALGDPIPGGGGGGGGGGGLIWP